MGSNPIALTNKTNELYVTLTPRPRNEALGGERFIQQSTNFVGPIHATVNVGARLLRPRRWLRPGGDERRSNEA
jgi:hypothetical protein